jgi:beta-lactamase regulating signal transducer with metallopeptidase domain
VLVSEHLDCSLVIGPWAPSVVLCRADMERLTPEELRGLLAHELAHVRRQDLWTGFLPSLARLLFFFDPLVWLACREYDLAREAACDAEALRVSGMPLAAYGRLLLKLGVHFRRRCYCPAATFTCWRTGRGIARWRPAAPTPAEFTKP